jgi:hypothetical protein
VCEEHSINDGHVFGSQQAVLIAGSSFHPYLADSNIQFNHSA